jgi:CheY-like chemotaxis protein
MRLHSPAGMSPSLPLIGAGRTHNALSGGEALKRCARSVDEGFDCSSMRPDHASMPFAREIMVELPEFLQDLEAALRPVATAKGLGFVLRCRTPIPTRLTGESRRLWQVLMAVAESSVHCASSGGIAIGCSVTDVPAAPTIAIDVAHGPRAAGAIDRDAPSSAWCGPDERASLRSSETWPGAGMTLALARTIAQVMGGDLLLRRVERGMKGSEGGACRITLPIDVHPTSSFVFYESRHVVRPSEFDRRRRTHAALAPPRALLAEQSLESQRIVRHCLGRAGISVDTAGTGREAFERLAAAEAVGRPYAILITDLRLPAVDGITLVRRARSMGLRLPILALSDEGRGDDRRRALDAGCDEFMAMPFRREALVAACERWLDEARSRAA